MKQYWHKFISWLELIGEARAAAIATRYGRIKEAKEIMMK
jgi:hypothetical protein